MGEIILKNAIKREMGYMYYIDGQGNVCRAKMGRQKKTEQKSSGKEEAKPLPVPDEAKETPLQKILRGLKRKE